MKRSMYSLFVVGALTHHAVAQPAPAAPTPEPASDDLSKAADATAEAAAVAPTTAGPAKASSDDIDLSSLGLDVNTKAFDDKLNVYGFVDINHTYSHFLRPITASGDDARTFYIGNVNLYLAKNFSPKLRALTEVRFTMLPNGSQGPNGTLISTTATDPTNFGRNSQWGGILIERAYAEYDLTDHLTIRAGHWLTPYGVWNIDHGSPTILVIGRPYAIGSEFFPEHQTGLDLLGNHYFDDYKVDFHLTASNGRGGSEAQQDLDNKMAFGGRLQIEAPWGLKIGGSYYRGRSTDLQVSPTVPAATFLEQAYAGDVTYDNGGLHVQAEAMQQDIQHPLVPSSGMVPAVPAHSESNFAAYVLGGYRMDILWSMMPYIYLEQYEPAAHFVYNSFTSYSAGLNFRPTPSFVLKVQLGRASFNGPDGIFAGNKVYFVNSQVSWAF